MKVVTWSIMLGIVAMLCGCVETQQVQTGTDSVKEGAVEASTEIAEDQTADQDVGAEVPVPTSDTPAASGKWPTAFKRRSYQLGITLSQFRGIRHPDQKEWPNAFAVFSTEDRVVGSPFHDAELYGSWEKAGVIKAHYFYKSPIGIRMTFGAGLMLGRIGSDTKFYFYPDQDGAEPVLFYVESGGPSDEFAYVAELYREAMGEPTAVRTESLQNRMGATFTNEIVEYANDVSVVRISRFGESLDVLQVEYILLPVWARLADRLQTMKQDDARRL